MDGRATTIERFMVRRPYELALVGTALLTVFLLSVLRQEGATLSNSIVDLSIFPTIRRSEVHFTQTTPLAGALSSRTLTAAEGPYLLQGEVRVPRGVTVRIVEGTMVATAEGARLVVEGTLEATRAVFQSNHLHPDRRLWHGITAVNGGKITLAQSAIRDASAGVVCAAGGSVNIRGGSISESAAGVVTMPESATCTTEDLRITEGRVGVQAIGGAPYLSNVTVDRVADGVRVFHQARPAITDFRVHHPLHTAIVYGASPDLVVRGLILPPDADRDALVMDGTDAPTHQWNDQDVPTGRIQIK